MNLLDERFDLEEPSDVQQSDKAQQVRKVDSRERKSPSVCIVGKGAPGLLSN